MVVVRHLLSFITTHSFESVVCETSKTYRTADPEDQDGTPLMYSHVMKLKFYESSLFLQLLNYTY